MRTVRIVEHTRVINWNLLLQEGGEGNSYRDKLVGQLHKFFDNFKGCRLKIGRNIIINSIEEIFQLINIIRQRKLENSDFNPFDDNIADDILSALIDDEADAIWLQGGGNASDILKSEQYITQLINEIHIKSINLKVNSPKPIIGYCFAVPLLIYLSSRNLVKAIHGPVAFEIVAISEFESNINKLRKIFFNDLEKQSFTGLLPCNKVAENIIEGRIKPKGLVIGGLLQIIINSLKVALLIEKHLEIKIISNKPILLFIELIDFGDELRKTTELFELITKNNLVVNSVTLGYILPNMKKNVQETEIYYEQINKKLNEVAMAADSVSIPVAKGLKIGHIAPHEPILFGEAEITFNKVDGSLELNYFSHTLGILDIQKHMLWGGEKLKSIDSNALAGTNEKSLVEQKNVGDLCRII